jgi:hypothetical protein
VDARLHHLQGKAKLVKATELLEVLREIYRDRLALRNRYVAAAAHVADYNFNNTYQYVINRSDGHVRWLQDAITEMGGTPEDLPLPDVKSGGKGRDGERSVITGDRDEARRFVEKWTPRIDTLPNARHKTMLRLMLGEVREQERFFEQAMAGRDDLLGRRADGAGTGGGVLPTRWVG